MSYDNDDMMMALIIVLIMVLSQSSAFLMSPIRHRSISSRVLQKVEGFLSSKDTNKIITSRHRSSSIYTSRRETTVDHEQNRQTALLWLSTNRLRIRDNLALCKAAELGTDELTICICWPHDVSKSNSIHELTPVQAFGYAALHSLNDSLAELRQKLWFVPTRGCSGNSDDVVSIMAKTTEEINPKHVIVDVSLLDKHCNYTSKLLDKLQSMIDDNTITYIPNVVEVFDDGLLVPFDRVSKALGRSRMGGRALRWSTFLSNTIPERDEYEKPTLDISSLPPPLADVTISTSIPIPKVDSFPSWAQQLLIDWGDVSEDEAILRASIINRSIERSSDNRQLLESEQTSSLTERGSINTKLSPYLRFGMISPQRAAKAGVRRRDILWRDWSYVCYGLLGPIRRGEAVLEFMDKSCHSVSNCDNKDELFKLWCVGNTGSPLVDASMRQLWSEGWISRRLRLLTAACLVEGLGLDWRLGRDWFEYTLIDHDPAINEMMWQNAGLCGVDPFYRGNKWDAPPSNESDEEYVQYWMNRKLIWPPSLEAYAIQEPPPQIIEEAESKRDALRVKGVYKAAKMISNSGVRVAWPGLNNAQSIKEGEILGVGATPVSELSI